MTGGHQSEPVVAHPRGYSGSMPSPLPTPPSGLFDAIDQSPLLAGILATVIGGLVLALLYRIPKLKPLFAAVGGAVKRAAIWVIGIRPTTRDGREALRLAGYDQRDDEVKKERAHSPRPNWRVSHRNGDDFIYVHNSGYPVKDVVVHADESLFIFADGATQGFINGTLGDSFPGSSPGRQVSGQLTKEGRQKGVEFRFAWTDQNGDLQPHARPDLPSSATLAPLPLQSIVQPTWQIGTPAQSPAKDIWALANGAAGSVTKNVRIDADANLFTFMLKKELGDLEGIGVLRFAGRPTEAGTHLGVDFHVTYEDANGEERTELVPARFPLEY